MAVNYVNSGERINYTIPSSTTITSGQVIVLESKIFVALSGGTENEEITLSRTGRFTLAKAAVTITQGETLYWDAGASKMTDVSTSNNKAGLAAVAAASGDATVECILISNV